MCHNAQTGVTAMLLTRLSSSEKDARRVTSSPRHKLKSKFFKKMFFLILCLFDFSAILLLLVLQTPVVGFTNLYQSIRVTMHVVMN